MPFRVWSKYAWNCVVDSQVTLNHWFTSTRLCFYFVLLLVLLVYCLMSAGCQFELSCCFYVQYLWFCVLIVDLFCFCFASFLAHVLYMCFHLYTDRSFCLKVALQIVAENATLRSLPILIALNKNTLSFFNCEDPKPFQCYQQIIMLYPKISIAFDELLK